MSTTSIQHIAIWWLREPDNAEHVQELTAAAEQLATIPGVVEVKVGPRSRLPWDGPDTTFDLGLIVTFESRDAAIAYIPHPTHLQAIAASDRVAERVQAFYFNG